MNRRNELDSGWVGADPDDDLDRQLLEEDDAFDRSQPHILTALGPIEPGALGPALASEVIGRLASSPGRNAPDARHELIAELEDVYASGVRGIAVECAAGELGRVLWLAGRVQPNMVLLAPPDAFANAASPPELGGVLIDPLQASGAMEGATVALRRGLPVRITANGEAMSAIALAKALAAEGIPEAVISISGLDCADAAIALASCGASVTLSIDSANPERDARAISALAAAGHGGRIAIASGISDCAALLAFGGDHGPGWVMATVPLLLMDAGVDALAVRALFIDNPANMLTIAGETAANHD